jgi:hypothetical protein
MPTMDVTQLIRDTYAERENAVLRMAEPRARYTARPKSRKKPK